MNLRIQLARGQIVVHGHAHVAAYLIQARPLIVRIEIVRVVLDRVRVVPDGDGHLAPFRAQVPTRQIRAAVRPIQLQHRAQIGQRLTLLAFKKFNLN